jgi:hypothetical protein
MEQLMALRNWGDMPGIEDLARRLRALQQAIGDGVPVSHEEMADFAGCGATAWQNYQSGLRQLPFENAANLRLRFGVTLDWIYIGDASRNPPDLQRKIDAALKNPVPLRRGPKASKENHS